MNKQDKTIKINFCDMFRGFDPNHNMFTEVIQNHFAGYELAEKPDFLIYSCFGTQHHKYDNCVKIFFTGEAITPNFNECDYAIAFDKMEFGERYCRKPIWITHDHLPAKCPLTKEEALNRKFCNFIYSNENNGNNVKLRKIFAKKLMKYKRVDCPGKVLNNMQDVIAPRDGDWEKGKRDFIKNYKFTIAFENSSFEGYTTEKMTDPLSAYSIPIYWGNPKVTEDFNENAFVNCNGYEQNFDKIIEKIIELDQNDDLYLKMLYENPMSDSYDPQEREKMNMFLYHIFMKGNKPYTKDPMNFVRRMSFDNLSRKDKFIYLFKKRK